MFVQRCELAAVLRRPRFISTAEVQDRSVDHNPIERCLASGTDDVVGVFPRVVIPHLVGDGQCALAIQGVEDVLVGEEQLSLVLHGKSKDLVGVDECFGPRHVHEDHAGVEVELARVEAHVVEGRCRMDRIGMGRGSEYAGSQFDVEERRERIDDEDVGVEIQGSVYLGVDDMRRQHAIVHLLRVSLA